MLAAPGTGMQIGAPLCGLHQSLAIGYAALGRCTEAAREIERGSEPRKPAPRTMAWKKAVMLRMNVSLHCGDLPHAVGWADTLLRGPGAFPPAALRLSPYYAPLRGRPDFERLLAGK
jgi:hypothetical protein